MIKLIIFDLDGVLVEAKKIHYEALNQALTEEGNQFTIDWDEHLNVFDGLKTSEKLKLLHERKSLPIDSFSRIWERKQKITLEALKEIKFNKNLYEAFSELSKKYKIACCSNSIRKTILTVLSRLGIIEFFDLILSNEDVINSKPHPEIYWKAISAMSCLPEEVLILEDSPYGLLAASRSHSNLLRIREPQEVNLTNIKNRLNELNNKKSNMIPKWKDKNLNVLIPMAGAGSRFEKAGYTFPKPLIEVDKNPMIQVVVENLNIDANYIFIVQKSHREKYNLDTMLNLIAPNCKIVDVDGVTEGAACTTLLAKEFINNDCPLVMANSDQFVEWNSNDFMYSMNETGCDGGIVTFTATHPKWSFAKVDELTGLVSEVAEKNPISDMATVGIYYWSKGSDYVKYAEEMIKENIRVNNEFYVCPVFNQAIKDNKKIRTYKASEMWGLGTPEDLENYMKNKK
jgi:HAD superfamily hydrolase (TIGR01509 family)